MDSKVALPPNSVQVACSAPVNIAVIKYWGKRDVKLNVPINSSLSGTIHQGTMQSHTVITASKSYKETQMTLNGNPVDVKKNKRMAKVISELRARAQDYADATGHVLIPKSEWPEYKLSIVSNNNFPTAAGLASSASGFACLTKCLAELFRVKESYPGELSVIARQGSGSACRSLDGGFVKWEMGTRADGLDSKAVQVADELHWPEMRVIILVANSGPKKVSSTTGMQETVATSPLIKFRAEHVVPKRMEDIEKAIVRKDFDTFARITMADSNQFHAVCLDTYPPIFYMNETSKKIVEIVHAINGNGPAKVAYTYDAGPNAVLYLLDKDLPFVYSLLLKFFQPQDQSASSFVTDPMGLVSTTALPADALEKYTGGVRDPDKHRVFRMIVSKLGPGATIQSQQHSFGGSKL